MLVHACYYAMFHAARACLLKTTGAAPKRHDQVIRQFAVLVKDGDETARQAGRDLNTVWDLRVRADYGDVSKINAEQGSEVLRKASGFISLCARLLGFPHG